MGQRIIDNKNVIIIIINVAHHHKSFLMREINLQIIIIDR